MESCQPANVIQISGLGFMYGVIRMQTRAPLWNLYYLQIVRKTNISPFRFEQRFAGKKPPSRDEIQSLGPWDYQIEWSDVSSKDIRQNEDWKVHRYRSSLLVDLASDLAGPTKAEMSVLDVGVSLWNSPHSNLAKLDLDLSKGLDLRDKNIQQARISEKDFRLPHCLSFEVENARNLKGHKADVVLCGDASFTT